MIFVVVIVVAVSIARIKYPVKSNFRNKGFSFRLTVLGEGRTDKVHHGGKASLQKHESGWPQPSQSQKAKSH